MAYAGAFIDAGVGIKENIEAGTSWDRTASDAVVDLAVSSGSILAAGFIGGKIGTVAGSFAPGIGNIVGAVTGFVIGIFFYIGTDVIEIKGKTIREHIKDAAGAHFWGGGIEKWKLVAET